MCIPKKTSKSDSINRQHKHVKSHTRIRTSSSSSSKPSRGSSKEAEMFYEEKKGNGDGHDEKGNGPGSKEHENGPPNVNQSFKVAKSSKRAKDMVEHWVNRALDVGVQGLVDEFRSSLAKWQPEGMTTVAFLANRDKNRYLDVPCQDQRRVILNWPGLPNDYIHANYVANPARDHRFICAQGPLDNTQLAFWAMVIQEKCEAIIMLCNTIECGKFKCSQYWPHDKGEVYSVGEGEGKITVTNLDILCAFNSKTKDHKIFSVDSALNEVRPMSEEDSFVRVCKLKLDYLLAGKPTSQIVQHFQWENWPDRGVPPTRLTATNLLSQVRGTTTPILVHCSAGIGRTGTIVAIAYVQEKMQHGQNCMDMDALTKELRTQRPYSIQNEFQYIYLHRVLLAYFLEKYRDRFAHILAGEGEAKYAKWLEDYKALTGCD